MGDKNDIFTEKESKGETEKKYKRDHTNMKDYYKAWDKFDVDKELDEEQPS